MKYMSRVFYTLLLLFVYVTMFSQLKTTTSDKPNIIYILADDLGYGDLSCYGQNKFSTPNIDKLATGGMKFTQHYSGSTVCAPSRSVLMTGQHTGHTTIRGNKEVFPEGQWPLAQDDVTIARLLKDAGYATGAFGKWGLGNPGSEGDPNNQGFDTFFGYNCQRLAHNYYTYHLWHNQEKVMLDENSGTATGTYAPNLIQQETLQFIEQNKDTSFFLYVPSIIPHAELLVPDEYIAKYRGKFDPEHVYYGVDSGPGFRTGSYGSQYECHAAFAGMIDLLDEQVGQIVDKLESLGIADNTIIFFSSDNGAHNEGGAQPYYFDSNSVFRGYKRDLYEGGIRAPFIAYWPGTIAPGTESGHISAFWDFLPTITELTGAQTPEDCDGISFLPTLTGTGSQSEHDYLYWEFHEGSGRQAIRMGEWKGVRHNVKNDWDAPWELYNLSTDISEWNNIAGNHPEIISQFNNILDTVRTPSDIFPFNEDLTPIEFNGNHECAFYFDGNANDYSGNEWHATEDGITFISDDPERGAVAEFNSTYSTITGNFGWEGAEPRSISAWIKTTEPNRLIIASGTKLTGQKFSFLINADGTLRVEAEGGYIYGTTILTDGKWHHVACTFEDDGTPDVTDVKLYVDGTPEIISNQLSVTINTQYSINICIGKDFNRDDRNYVGRMDDLQLWAEALSAEEVQQLADETTNLQENISNNDIEFKVNDKTLLIENKGGVVVISFYNIIGKLVKEEIIPAGNSSVNFNAGGVYIAVVRSNNNTFSKKIII